MTAFLTPKEVADQLRISASMVRKLTKEGRLRPIYVGRLPRYEQRDVDAYVAWLRDQRRPRVA